VLAEFILGQRADVVAVEQDPPGRRVVEARQQVRDRRLARAAGPDQRDPLAGTNLKAYIIQRERRGLASGRLGAVAISVAVSVPVAIPLPLPFRPARSSASGAPSASAPVLTRAG